MALSCLGSKAMKDVKIVARAVPGKGEIRFMADVDSRPAFTRTVKVETSAEAAAAHNQYKLDLLAKFPNVQISPLRPNIFRAFLESRPKSAPAELSLKEATTAALKRINNSWPGQNGMDPNNPVPTGTPEASFEVNMMEALVGWKGFKIRRVVKNGVDYGQMLYTNSPEFLWYPDVPTKAECRLVVNTPHGHSPSLNCSCGIYAADSRESAKGYGPILAKIYGWGRYVRGSAGWRAQFCYPKIFLLHEEQVDLIEPLKSYHVPIYIEQPMRVYNPEEEGYTCANWGTETNWNRGTDPVSDTAEGSGYEDYEED